MTDTDIIFQPIGHVENGIEELVAPEKIKAVESRIVLDPAFAEGLQGLVAGQRVLVVFHFHRVDGFQLCQHPRGDAARPKRGVFALRTPSRPNPIGVTEADLLAIEGSVLRVRGLDAVNGTPVLDLKPG